MKLLLQEIRRNPLLWLLVFVPIALAAEKFNHEAHTLHFVLSVLAILPLAVLLSHATESVAEDGRFRGRSAERDAWKSH
jgi:Ca2+:H+ antiporter